MYLGPEEAKKEKEWKNFQETSMVGRKWHKKKDLAHKIVNLLICLYVMFMLYIDLLYCFTLLCEVCMNEWSFVSVFALAISMLHETLSMQNIIM